MIIEQGIFSVINISIHISSSNICCILLVEYAQDHGFLSSLFIGPIVGEIKGLLFPFFI
jgi:hypothetical protein